LTARFTGRPRPVRPPCGAHRLTGRFSGLPRRRRADRPALLGLVAGKGTTFLPHPGLEPVSTGFCRSDPGCGRRREGRSPLKQADQELGYSDSRPATSPQRTGLLARLRRESPVNGAAIARRSPIGEGPSAVADPRRAITSRRLARGDQRSVVGEGRTVVRSRRQAIGNRRWAHG
jgi:hypothetical protein